eukprot:520349_1
MSAFEKDEYNSEAPVLDSKEEDELDELHVNHRKIIEKTKNSSLHFFVFTVFGELIYSLCSSVWILKIYELQPSITSHSIAIITLFQQICAFIGILIVSWLADKYYFDLMAVIVSFIILFANILQFIAILLPVPIAIHYGSQYEININIIIFSCGIMLEAFGGYESATITLGFISKMLPFKVAAEYTGYFYVFEALGYGLGFVLSGIIAQFINLTAVYILASIMALIRCIYVSFTLINIQKPLTKQQLKFIEYETSDQFPLCLEEINNNNGTRDKWYWFELVSNMIQFALVVAFEPVFIPWYLIYMKDRFNTDIITNVSQLLLVCVFYTLVLGISPTYIAQLA